MAFVLYLVVHLSTMVYFVPEQEGLISNAGSLSGDVLRSRANRWIFLNYSLERVYPLRSEECRASTLSVNSGEIRYFGVIQEERGTLSNMAARD